VIGIGSPGARRGLCAVFLLGGLALASAGQAAPGRRAVAPGRVVFPVDGGIPTAGVDGPRASQVVALPGGGAVLVGGGFPGGKGFYAAALTATGSLDPSFGSHGIDRVSLSRRVVALEVLRQPDGKLVVVGSSGSAERRLVIVRLDGAGAIDQTFGSGGLASTPVATACESCTPAALTPDGQIILTGQALGSGGSPVWIVTRLTGSGAVDQTFGHEGTITLPEAGASGYDVSVLDDGFITTLGVTKLPAARTSIATLTRLRPDGLPDFDFNGGTPGELPGGSGASAMLVDPDGSVVIGGTSALFRYTSVGAPDAGFGTRGVVRIGALPSSLELLPAAGGATLVVGRSARASALRVVRVAADGGLDPSLGGPSGVLVGPLFGGGASSVSSPTRPRRDPSVSQNSFTAGAVALRADGSYLAVGGVSVSQLSGRAAGRSVFDFAAAALTPSLTPDAQFGGMAKGLTLSLSIPRQSGGSAHATRAIIVALDASAPGLARVTIKAHGRVIARSVVGILGSGPRNLRIGLTAYGSSVVGGGPGLRLTASAVGRDLVAASAHASASGTLR
jgi:uncharacterized delta-60 repeat protein